MTDETFAYKIHRKSDGLYSTGGTYPSFSKNGKIWNQIGHLKSHLAQINKTRNFYNDCEIVKLVTSTVGIEENALQIMTEQGIIKSANPSYPSTASRNERFINMLKRFVIDGLCYSPEFKSILCTKRSKLRAFAEEYVPLHMLENFEVYHNKGISGCSNPELGAVILTATQEQITMFKL